MNKPVECFSVNENLVMKSSFLNQHALLPGETPLPSAPAVVLDDGTNCIPQHFLSYQHTLESVSDIIAGINFDPHYVIFADQENSNTFIQVGIVGRDNYQKFDSQTAMKIVYGRRWKVEPQLPSSEIIQTAFLALLKAREHEIRELLKYKTPIDICYGGKQNTKFHITTPFSCHHDLPLISMGKATNTESSETKMSLEELSCCFEKIRYDFASFQLLSVKQVSYAKLLINARLQLDKRTTLPELLNLSNASTELVFLVESLTEDSVMYGLMDELLHLSQRYVEEHFTFKGYARFSRKQSVQKISELSAKTRLHVNIDGDFASTFSNSNYEVDETRVPRINPGILGNKISEQLKAFDIKYGILPKNSKI